MMLHLNLETNIILRLNLHSFLPLMSKAAKKVAHHQPGLLFGEQSEWLKGKKYCK